MAEKLTKEELATAADTIRKLRFFYEEHHYTAVSHFEFLDRMADYIDNWSNCFPQKPKNINAQKRMIESIGLLNG